MWNKVEHDFGNIKSGSTIEYTFEHDKSKIIRNIKPSCSCLSIYPNGNKLRVVWKTRKDIKESFESFRFIYITYPFNEVEILELKATLMP